MTKIVHVIGNGSSATLFRPEDPGIKLTCNLPPFPVNATATCIVDYKMMLAIADGSLTVPGDWVLGFRPKDFCHKNPGFYMKHAGQIKEWYTHLPKYAPNYRDFNCGHMATHYAATKYNPDKIYMYGFDSIFDFDLRSCSDFYLFSNRDRGTTHRLTENWRNIWPSLFAEFPNTEFVLVGKHKDIKIQVPENVTVEVRSRKK